MKTMSFEGKIIFVGGAPRSGTTLVRNVLDSHPEICSGPEFDLLPSIIKLWTTADNKLRSGRISAYLSQDELQTAFVQFIRSLFEPYRRKRGKPHMAEKTPSNVLVFPLLHRLMPQAFLVHVVRDGRDAVASMLEVASQFRGSDRNSPQFARSIENAANTWVNYVSAPMQDMAVFESQGFQEKYIEIRYEDIISYPKRTLEALCQRLQIDFSQSMLSPELYPHVFVEYGPWGSKEKVNAPIHDSSMGRWRRDLTLVQRVVVARYCHSQLARFGYVSSRQWIWEDFAGQLVLKPGDDLSTITRLIRRWFYGRNRLLRSKIWARIL